MKFSLIKKNCFYRIVMAILGVLLLLCGCSPTSRVPVENTTNNTGNGESPEGLELTIYYDAATKEYMSSLVEQFRVEHPEVKIITKDYSDINMNPDYQTKLAGELMTGGGPDVILATYSTNNSLNNLTKLIKSGILLDVSEIGVDLSGCNERVMAGGRFDDKQYIVPLNYSLGFLYTTKERMEQYEIPYGKEITLEKFSEAIENYYGDNPGKKAFYDIFTIDFLYSQNGLDLINYKNNEFSIDKTAVDNMSTLTNALNNLFPNIYEKYNDYVINFNEYNNVFEPFNVGDVLFFNDSSMMGGYQTLRNVNSLYNNSIIKGETPIFFPLPNIDGEAGYSPVINYFLAVPASTSNKTAAKLFVESAVGFDSQFKSGSWYGIPVNNELMDFTKKWYSDESYDPNHEYALVKWCEFSPEFIQAYFDIIDNMSDATFTDSNSCDILREIFYSVVSEGNNIDEAMYSAKTKLEFYLNE